MLDQALAVAGRAADATRLVVLIGSMHGTLVEAAAERFPAPTRLLVLEPRAFAAEAVRALPNDDAELAERTILLAPEQLEHCGEFLNAYLLFFQFLLEVREPPHELTLVLDPELSTSPLARVLFAAASDLAYRLSHDFLHGVGQREDFADLLRAFADFLRASGEPYHAFKFYAALPESRRERRSIEGAFECLLALGNAPLIEHWLLQSELEPELAAELRARIPAALRAACHDRAARLERNRAFLARRFPQAVDALPAPSPDTFTVELVPAIWRLREPIAATAELPEAYPLVLRLSSRGVEELNPLPHLAELQGALQTCAAAGQDHASIGGWVRHAAIAFNLLASPSRIKQHGWKRIVFLVEEDAAALSALLQGIELEPLLELEQLRLFVGTGAFDALASALEQNMNQGVPGLNLGIPKELQQRILRRRTELSVRTPELHGLFKARCRGLPERLLHALRSGERPLRIALLTSRYTTVIQYVTRDLAAGFSELGHRCEVLLEPAAGENLVSHWAAERLLEFEPDVLVVIDHVRPEYGALLPEGLPVVTWILDEVPWLKDPRHIRQLGALDLAYGFSRAVQQGFLELGYPNVGHLPFAVNPEQYWPEQPDPSARGIAFTTHIGQVDPDPDGAPGLGALLEARLSSYPEVPLEMPRILPDLQACLSQLSLRPSEAQQQAWLYHALQLARQLDRQRVAEHIVDAGLPLDLYGLGWDKLDRFAPRARGVVAPGPELRDVYRRHRVVLHINRGCNIHPRVLETLCAGGLVIARWDPADDLPGETRDQLEELCLFRSRDELLSLLRRALEDDRFRREASERGQARVLRCHTYRTRARTILNDLTALLERYVRTPHRELTPAHGEQLGHV